MPRSLQTSLALGALCAITLVCVTPDSALAKKGKRSEALKLYDWPDATAPVLITTADGLLFLHADGKPFRTYTFRPQKKDALHVTDVDRDGKPDIVGFGSPTFVINTQASPVWFKPKACKINGLADIAADNKLDLLCSDGKDINIISHDNQPIWDMNIGRRFSSCDLGDTNGDAKADLECKSGRTIARIDGEGSLADGEAKESAIIEGEELYEAYAPSDIAIVQDKQTFDIDKDGVAEEYLEFDGPLLAIKSKSKPKPLSMFEVKGEVLSALVKDIDNKGMMEVIILTDKQVAVLSADGKSQQTFDLKLKRYKPTPIAELRSVYANGFVDDAAAQKSVSDVNGALAKCYAGQIKKSQFAGSGQVLLEVKVDDKAKVTGVNRLHSDLADKKIVTCAKKALKTIKAPAAKEGEVGRVNITVYYTFRTQ